MHDNAYLRLTFAQHCDQSDQHPTLTPLKNFNHCLKAECAKVVSDSQQTSATAINKDVIKKLTGFMNNLVQFKILYWMIVYCNMLHARKNKKKKLTNEIRKNVHPKEKKTKGI